nr:MAG TPA: hypothetical protein [Caudoviricetes sp.]
MMAVPLLIEILTNLYFRVLKLKMVFEILVAWENKWAKIFQLFPEIHAPGSRRFTLLKRDSHRPTPALVR